MFHKREKISNIGRQHVIKISQHMEISICRGTHGLKSNRVNRPFGKSF